MTGRTRFLLAIALSLGAAGDARAALVPVAPPSVAPAPAAIAWIKVSAVPVGPTDAPPNAAEAAVIDRIVGNARIVALGEPGHGWHEPLAYRNRLIRYLVEHRGLTAVVFETGLAGSRRIDDYILGGAGDADRVVHGNLDWGFDLLPANVALVRWLRRYNADPSHRAVHFYGSDMSGGTDEDGYAHAPTALGDVLAYLAATIPGPSAAVRARLSTFQPRFTTRAYPGYSPADRAQLAEGLAAARSLFARHRTAMVAATTSDTYDWAAREVHDCQELQRLFTVWTDDPLHELDKLKAVLDIRDRAMADTTVWALRREGPKGRILLFQANGHVVASPMVGHVMRRFKTLPPTSGKLLRSRLGDRYRVIVTASALGGSVDATDRGSIDRAFVATGGSRVLIDTRHARPATWWATPQSLTYGTDRVDDLTPATAFDGILFIDRLTKEVAGVAPVR